MSHESISALFREAAQLKRERDEARAALRRCREVTRPLLRAMRDIKKLPLQPGHSRAARCLATDALNALPEDVKVRGGL